MGQYAILQGAIANRRQPGVGSPAGRFAIGRRLASCPQFLARLAARNCYEVLTPE